jgi:hypothetical protein
MKVASTHRGTRPRGPRPRSGGTSGRRWSALLSALLVAVGAFLVAPAQPAAAQGNGEWSIDPQVPEGADQNSRRYFFLEGAPGSTIQDSAVVANTSNRTITFDIFGSDATNTPRDGGFALDRAQDPKDEVGAWIQIPEQQRRLTLEPNQRVRVPFAIVIPQNARPGDHIGGVVALNTAIEGTQQQGDIQINIQRQIGARVYLRVAGDIVPGMTVENVRVERESGFGSFFGSSKATIHYTVVNRGNIIVRPKFEIEATGLFGRDLMHREDKNVPVELMPGQQVELRQTWNDAPRLDRVSVKVTATTDISVAATAGAAPSMIKDSGSASFTAVPWPALLLLAFLLIAGGVAWQYFRGQRGKGDGGKGAKPEGPKPSGDPEAKKPADVTSGKNGKGTKPGGTETDSPATPATAPQADTTPEKETPEETPEEAPDKETQPAEEPAKAAAAEAPDPTGVGN